MSLKQSENSWWFRIEFLITIIHEICQKYWISEVHLIVNENIIFYLEHIWHAIKTSYKFIKQDYKIWALADFDYIFSWFWYSKTQDMKNLDMRSCQNIITDIQILILSLAKSLLNLNSAQSYILYFDNFLSMFS